MDNDGCHGERERHSHHKSLSVGAHHVVLDMCEMGGGQNFKFHYQGPDTGVAKVKVPSSVLRHEAKAQWGAMLTTFSLVTRSGSPKRPQDARNALSILDATHAQLPSCRTAWSATTSTAEHNAKSQI